MKRFKVMATRTDEYIIEIDEQIVNEAWMENFSSYMHPVDELEDLAKDLAYHQLRVGSDYRFIEGFGPVLRNGQMPFSLSDYDKDGKELPADKKELPAEGFNIIIIDEEDYDFEVTEDPA